MLAMGSDSEVPPPYSAGYGHLHWKGVAEFKREFYERTTSAMTNS